MWAVSLGHRRLLRHRPTADEKKRGRRRARQAAEFAQEVKVKLAIEYLNRFECYFLTTAADASALVQGRRSSVVPHDVRHVSRQHRGEERRAGHRRPSPTHHSRPHQRERSRHAGHGPRPLGRDVQSLRKIGYDGWMTIEAFGRACPTWPPPRKSRATCSPARGSLSERHQVHQRAPGSGKIRQFVGLDRD